MRACNNLLIQGTCHVRGGPPRAALLVLLYFLLEIPQGHHILNAHSWEPVHGLNAVNTIVWATCFMLIEQDMIQRYVSAKSSSILKKALWGAVIGLTSIAVLPTLIGIYAKKVGVPATESGSIGGSVVFICLIVELCKK